ncbi:MAG TPA: T9SS type A sorting domain-containing protein, partial [Candidatus Kapabacteria bacterium]|nr:T9SS type A sorting domain-containing protein [Candidatus Kapabacteria bacterium]
YTWSTGAKSETITVTQPGTYTVTVADATGCSGTSDPVTVTQGHPPVPVITGLDTVCVNSQVQYAVSAVAGDAYAWTATGGAIIAGNGTNAITVQWAGAGNGTVSVTQTRGSCSGSATENVSIGSGVSPTITASGALSFCTGDSVTLTAPNGFATYRWSDGETTQSIIVKVSGTYTVTVTAAGGCTGTSAPVMVMVGSTLVPVITGAGAFCPGGSATLDAGAGYDTYQWSTGATTETIVVTTPGTYTVSVTKGSCAGTSAGFAVTEYPAPTATIATSGDTLISTQEAAYQWSLNGTAIPGATSQRYVPIMEGSYTVTITDANGCAGTSPAYQQGALTAELCSPSPAPVLPAVIIDLPVTLSNTIIAPVDSVVFDLVYNPSALLFETVTSPICGLRQQRISAGEVQITAFNCGTPMNAGDIADAQFYTMVTSSDTTYTQIGIDSIMFYPAGSVAGSGCSVPVTINPLCGLKGVLYTGATSLSQNYPNPFSGMTNIEVRVPNAGAATLKVYNIYGEEVADLTDQLRKSAEVTFAAENIPTGVYYYVLETASGRITRQMFVVK